MEGLLSKRAILVTGKGGVGKTAITAALARFAAARGRRVLVAEVGGEPGRASPLATAFGMARIEEEPLPYPGGVDAVALTASAGHRCFLRDTLPVRVLADAAMRSSAIRRFLSAAPAFAEMGVLYRMLDLLRRRRRDATPEYDLFIVDSPATGHALAITQLPEVILKVIPHGPIGNAVREGLTLLTDPAHTATLIVALPETLPVSEAIELARGLRRHRVPLSAAVLNRVPGDPFTLDERAHIDRIDAAEGPFLGSRAVRSIDRARAAIARLQEGLGLPTFTLPERPEGPPQLADALAQAIGRTWSSAAAPAGGAAGQEAAP